FCCQGCKQVFRILMEATDSVDPADFQTTELFKKCQAMGIIPRSESDLAKKDRDSVSPTAEASRFTRTPVETDPHSTSGPNRLPLYLNVSGMWCPACAWVIEETMKKDAGVFSAACYFSTDRVRCEYDPVRTSPEKIATTIRQLGYGVEPDDDDSASAWKRKEFLRFAISAFLTLNIMMLSFALYSGFFTELSKNEIRMISWPIFIMASIVFFYGGIKIHQRALSSFTTATFGMETLISVGSSITYLYSTYNFTMGSLHLYFDTAAMLITLVLLGKTLETKAKNEVLKDLDSFFSLKPKKVEIWSESDSQGRYVSIKQLGRGDLFRVEADEIVAADGIVMEGTGVLDESALTGEARPVVKKPGDMIRSGSSVIKGDLKVKARRIGEESILGQMISIMENSLERRTPLEGKTDRILQWFVPGVILLAFCAGIICLLSGISIEDAVIRSVTVLVISCPCALGIAIPLARIAGITVSARNGMLIRDFSCFERTDRLSDFVFDKTGTITHGQWELIRIVIHEPFSKEGLLALAAGLEKDSDHYIALAIQRYVKAQRISPENVQNITVCDNGVTGNFDRKKIKIGSWDFLRPVFSTDNGNQAFIDASDDENTSRVYMGIDDAPAAVFEFGDRVKDGAAETIKALHIMGYATALISGDGDRTTRLIGRNIGIGKSLGGMLPTAKAEFVRDLKKNGHVVAMVGDGINDAPALAQSDLALAVHGGHLLGKEVADVSLMRGDPRQVLDFLELAKKVNRKIQQNFIGAFLYNIISIPIAMSGLLTPLVAVSAMLLSSLSVIGNTLLLIKGKGR
ncbi:MAG: cation-translocating P-type ATPase, partial [Thermodesulfobacteriota bacterium]|nr:cation-translocating P-type ATPase [Thermodesulfobacteriota bacterium]